MFGIVIDRNGFKVDIVHIFEDKTLDSYILKNSESIISIDNSIGDLTVNMNKPKWDGEKWIDTEPREQEPYELISERLDLLLLNGWNRAGASAHILRLGDRATILGTIAGGVTTESEGEEVPVFFTGPRAKPRRQETVPVVSSDGSVFNLVLKTDGSCVIQDKESWTRSKKSISFSYDC